MHAIEIIVGAGREAEHFDTALYRFIELKGSQREFSIIVRSEPLERGERKVVSLWDKAAAAEFGRYWRTFRLNRPETLPPEPFGAAVIQNRATA